MPYSYLLNTNLAGDLWIISFTNESIPLIKKKINKKIIRKIVIKKKK